MISQQPPNFRVEDYPEQKGWIDKFFVSINPFFESLNQVLNQNVDFSTNIPAVTKSYSITTFQPFDLNWPFKNYTPLELRITLAKKGSNQTPTVLLPVWSYNNGNYTISIHNLFEVSASGVSVVSGTYQFTVRVSI